jgi:hypothetical protein
MSTPVLKIHKRISTKDALPDGDYFVLVTVDGNDWPMVAFYDGKWYPSDIWDQIDPSKIIDWTRIELTEE